jgi:hypothetical protein
MTSDGSGGWTGGNAAGDGAQILTSTLAEPAVFYDPDSLEPPVSDTPLRPAADQADVGAPSNATTPPPSDLYRSLELGEPIPSDETLAELATMGVPTTPLRDFVPSAVEGTPDGDDLWASLTEAAAPEPAASGVHALRSLLLGHGPDHEARLELIEKRLEQVALYVTAEVQAARAEASRVTELGSRVDALAERVESALDFARGGDVSVHALSTLQQQIDELRGERSTLAQHIEARMHSVETGSRLRQREARTARRAELLRLRQRVYAPPESFGSSRLRGIERRASERALVAGGASDLVGSSLYAVRQGHDAGAAWHVFSHGIVVFFGALLTLIVVLARVTGEHLADAWDHLMALFGRD